MTELSTGGSDVGPPKPWIISTSWGFIENCYWDGLGPVSKDDLYDIRAYLSEPFFIGGPQSGSSSDGLTNKEINALLDWGSMVGRYHPDYRVNGEKSRWGGTGSETYEKQKVGGLGAGVDFTKEEIFCWTTVEPGTGEYPKWIPGDCGEHHYSPARGGSVVGPEPGSEAEKLLGEGRYIWNSTDEWYEIEV